MSGSPEWITAVMITGKPGRLPLAGRAVEAFRRQTHPAVELLIVNDSAAYRVLPAATLVEGCRQLRELTPPAGLTLGGLRNFALEHCSTPWVAQWDDDDWSHPQRLAEQLRYAQSHRAAACTLVRQVRYSVPTNSAFVWAYHKAREGIAGTVLHRATDRRYPAQGRHEDSLFVKDFPGDVGLWDNPPEMYVRFYWGVQHAWDEAHIMQDLTGVHDRWRLPPPLKAALRTLLERDYLDLLPERTVTWLKAR